MRPRLIRTSLLAVAVPMLLIACGDDDGADVRDIGEQDESASETGSTSGSESASASGTASGSASGSGSATGVAAECVPVGDIETADEVVEVEAGEWVLNMPDTIAAGTIGFEVTNIGAEPHEVVIIRGVAADDLPLDEHGALDESGLPDGALIGEIEPFPAGETCTGVFELEPGEYTFVCNIVETEESGETESHLVEGMVTEVTVG